MLQLSFNGGCTILEAQQLSASHGAHRDWTW